MIDGYVHKGTGICGSLWVKRSGIAKGVWDPCVQRLYIALLKAQQREEYSSSNSGVRHVTVNITFNLP